MQKELPKKKGKKRKKEEKDEPSKPDTKREKKRKKKKRKKKKKKKKLKRKRGKIKDLNEDIKKERKTEEVKMSSSKITAYRGFKVLKKGRGVLRKLKNFVDIYNTDNTYDLILADPPWEYKHMDTSSRLIKVPYPTMRKQELIDMGEQVKKISKKDCVLLMWATCTLLNEAVELIEHWGFKFVTVFLNWHKTDSRTSLKMAAGLGSYTRICVEYALLGVKGNPIPLKYVPSAYVIGDTVLHQDKHILLLAKRGKIGQYRSKDRQDFLGNVQERKSDKIELEIDEKSVFEGVKNIDNEIAEQEKHLEILKRKKKARDENNVGKILDIMKEENEMILKSYSGKYKVERNELYHHRMRHSEKPKMFYDMIERVFSGAKDRIELFARNSRNPKRGGKWDCFGNDENVVPDKIK